MCCVIVRGLSVAPPLSNRFFTCHDAVAKKKYGLVYVREGRTRQYRVYLGSVSRENYIGAVISWYNSHCWAFIPDVYGVGERWFLAPTRFEAINAFCRFDLKSSALADEYK